LVVRGGSGLSEAYFAQIYAHELTHRFVARCMPTAPRWLDEGLARYFETIRVGASEVVVGASPYRITEHGPASFRFRAGGLEILQMGADHFRAPSELQTLSLPDFYATDRMIENYAGGWAVVHMFMHGPRTELRTRFTDYLAGLSHTEDGASLFAASFADVAL